MLRLAFPDNLGLLCETVGTTRDTSLPGRACSVVFENISSVLLLGVWEGFLPILLAFCFGCAFTIAFQVLKNVWSSQRLQEHNYNVVPLSSTFDAISQGLLITDQDGRIVGANSKVSEVLGISKAELFQQDIDGEESGSEVRVVLRFVNNAEFLTFWNDVNAAPQRTASREFTLADTSPRTLLVHTAPVQCEEIESGIRLWSFHDISVQKQFESDLIQSQKMEAIGRLAGGIAHDFNNLLLAMNANLELTLMHPERAVSDAEEYLKAAERAVERASTLVKHLLGFSRKTNLELRVRNPNRVLERLQRLLQRILDARIELKFEFEPQCWNVRLDDTHTEQVLLNLCLNARDATSSKTGIVQVSSRNLPEAEFLELREHYCQLHELEPGDYVQITVSDNGSGIAPEVLPKIFDPFFTTKSQGKGTGLGLSMSFGIIRQHQGMIYCESELGAGSTFSILLPRTHDPKYQSGSSWSHSKSGKKMHGRILLADDDELVCLSTANALRSQGFEVVTAGNGLDALIHLRSNKKFDLAILDLSMPSMSGGEVLSNVRNDMPVLPVIMTSGYQAELEEFQKVSSSEPNLITIDKPFHLLDLLETIDRLLILSQKPM